MDNDFPPDKMPLDRCEFSVRTERLLSKFKTVGEARSMSDSELLKIHGFGEKSLKEFRDYVGYEPVAGEYVDPYALSPEERRDRRIRRASAALEKSAPALMELFRVASDAEFTATDFFELVREISQARLAAEEARDKALQKLRRVENELSMARKEKEAIENRWPAREHEFSVELNAEKHRLHLCHLRIEELERENAGLIDIIAEGKFPKAE